jgi:hypothetical protein
LQSLEKGMLVEEGIQTEIPKQVDWIIFLTKNIRLRKRTMVLTTMAALESAFGRRSFRQGGAIEVSSTQGVQLQTFPLASETKASTEGRNVYRISREEPLLPTPGRSILDSVRASRSIFRQSKSQGLVLDHKRKKHNESPRVSPNPWTDQNEQGVRQ